LSLPAKTEAWILESGDGIRAPGQLIRKTIPLPALGPEDVAVKPLYGCWEANIQHAIMRDPVDIAHQRGEEYIVPGNACVVEVLETGIAVEDLSAGDCCTGFGAIASDEYGYPIRIMGYDAPGRIGVLARTTIFHRSQLIPLPADDPYGLPQWAAFSARYVSAWSNWQVALRCWRSQMKGADPGQHFVCAWGGGVGLAELQLAQREGFRTIMISSRPERIRQISSLGIAPLDRSEFTELWFDPKKYGSDSSYRNRYNRVENLFLARLMEMTGGKGAAIFIENIGTPVYRATLKALQRQGVIATCGWKWGMQLNTMRALQCINRNIHVHTHYASRREVLTATKYALAHDWIPPITGDRIYGWDEIPQLSAAYGLGEIDSYFPVFRISARANRLYP
jgi:NADPH:quinone reductase-like Zn-dependent oxidoreductase